MYHPRGVQVTFPLLDVSPLGSLSDVAAYLDAGWLEQAPGLEAGEERKMVGFVCKGTKEDQGEVTPFLLLYGTEDKFSFVKVWMNTTDDIAAFEFASGMKLDRIPEYAGDNKPERGKSAKVDAMIVACPKPFGVVYKPNPKYDPAETDMAKKKPARLFVRWVDQRPAASGTAPASEPTRTGGDQRPHTSPAGRAMIAGIPRLVEAEAAKICDLIDKTKTNPESFRNYYDITRVLDLPEASYADAVGKLEAKLAAIWADEKKRAEDAKREQEAKRAEEAKQANENKNSGVPY